MSKLETWCEAALLTCLARRRPEGLWNTQSGGSFHVVAFLGHSYNWDHTQESCQIIPDDYFYHLNFIRFVDGWWEPALLSYQTLFFFPPVPAAVSEDLVQQCRGRAGQVL